MRLRSVLIIIGFFAFLAVPFFSLPSSFAVAPTVSQLNQNDQVATTAITQIFPGHTVLGDLIVVQIMENQSGSTALTVRDNQSDVYTLVTSVNSTGNPYDYTAIYYTIATANAGLRVTLNSSVSTSLGLFMYEITGISSVAFVSSTGTGGGCGCSVTPTINAPANSVSIAGTVSSAHVSGSWTFTGGFIGFSSLQQISAGEYNYPVGNQIFDMNYHAIDPANWAEAATIFYQAPVTTATTGTGTFFVTSIVYVGPNPASMNFWLFPMMFILIFAGVFFVEALVMRASPEDTTYMALIGVSVGAFVTYFMDMIPFSVLLIIVALMVVFAWRS